jgi:hypothetical protein
VGPPYLDGCHHQAYGSQPGETTQHEAAMGTHPVLVHQSGEEFGRKTHHDPEQHRHPSEHNGPDKYGPV